MNWDALADSLWSGLDALGSPRIALVWGGAERLKHADPRSFEIAADALLTAATQITGGLHGAAPGRQVSLAFGRL